MRLTQAKPGNGLVHCIALACPCRCIAGEPQMSSVVEEHPEPSRDVQTVLKESVRDSIAHGPVADVEDRANTCPGGQLVLRYSPRIRTDGYPPRREVEIILSL